MTREEAILCLKGMKNYGRDTFTEQTDWQESLDMAIKALEQKSETVTEFADRCLECGNRYGRLLKQTRWIPVSERLPEDGEDVLMNTAHFGVITGVYDSECDFLTHYSISSEDMASVEVIAWQPLPEPYKAEMGGAENEEN